MYLFTHMLIEIENNSITSESSLCPFPSSSPLCFVHPRVVLTVVELGISEIMQCVHLPTCFFWLGIIMSQRVICVVPCSSSSVFFFFITEYYFTLLIYHSMFISSPIHGYLDFIYFLAITHKTTMSILYTSFCKHIFVFISLG